MQAGKFRSGLVCDLLRLNEYIEQQRVGKVIYFFNAVGNHGLIQFRIQYGGNAASDPSYLGCVDKTT